MPKEVKKTKAAAKVITAETKKKEGTGTYQDEINTKTLDLIDTVSGNVQELFKSLKLLTQRLNDLEHKVNKVSNRVGIV
ncbi:MAG TPA: hypothetical protein DCX27_07295 [Balneola sp.]|nr:hypothetical protein [Balneola sp.]